jgi:hypothetical protein
MPAIRNPRSYEEIVNANREHMRRRRANLQILQISPPNPPTRPSSEGLANADHGQYHFFLEVEYKLYLSY